MVVAGRYTTPLLLPCVALLPVLLLVVAGTHRVGVAFSEGPELLPFYENLAKWPEKTKSLQTTVPGTTPYSTIVNSLTTILKHTTQKIRPFPPFFDSTKFAPSLHREGPFAFERPAVPPTIRCRRSRDATWSS